MLHNVRTWPRGCLKLQSKQTYRLRMRDNICMKNSLFNLLVGAYSLMSLIHSGNRCMLIPYRSVVDLHFLLPVSHATYMYIPFSGFSVGCCINREKVICYQLEFGK